MLRRLADEKCVPCAGDEAALSPAEQADFLSNLPFWSVNSSEEIPCLVRVFMYKSYADGVNFVQRLASIAEAEDHHPSIMIEWGKVTVRWWTHAVRGLHRNDFVMAAKTDRFYDSHPRA